MRKQGSTAVWYRIREFAPGDPIREKLERILVYVKDAEAIDESYWINKARRANPRIW